MSINFKNIPQNLRVPLFYAEVDNSRANTAQAVQRTLIIGQITSGGTAVPNVPIICQGVADAATQGGQDSMLALLTAAYRKADNFGEVWYLPLADDASATAATGTFAFNSPATANGTLNVYVAGGRYALPVATTQTTAQLATALAALINADAACPVNASSSTNTVTFTAVNKGLAGNEIDVRVNYGGQLAGETPVPGLTYTIVAMAGGATNPSLTTGLANLGAKTFDFIVCPYTDSISLDALKAFLADTVGRWSWTTQSYGHFFAARAGTLGTLTTFGTSRNDQHGTVMGVYDSPTPAFIWAAALTGAAAVSLRADPGTPLHALVIPGVLPPPVQSRFALSDRNTLLFDGISTCVVGDDGTVYIDNLITTYQKNAFGNADDSYLKVETMFLLAFVLRALRTVVTSKYARVKLADNGTRFGPGANVVTPNVIRSDLIAQYRELEAAAYVQNGDAFKEGLIVQKSTSNPNRVDVLYPVILINQLDIFALLAQFRLQA
jgi:phage tail sheath gpL-like